MGLAHFLYGEWDAAEAATAAQDELIKALIALEEGSDGDVAMAITSGYRSVWVGAQEVAAEDGDADLEYLSEPQAEKFYRECFLKTYVQTVRRSYPKYKADDDEGLAWWPDSLRLDSVWPRKLLARIAAVVGEIEAERGVAMTRHFEQREAQQTSAKE